MGQVVITSPYGVDNCQSWHGASGGNNVRQAVEHVRKLVRKPCDCHNPMVTMYGKQVVVTVT